MVDLNALKREARRKSTGPERLLALAASATELARAVAINPHAPASVLEALARHDDIRTRALVALHANTDPATLDQLAHDQQWTVQIAVPRNPNATPDALLHLVSHAKSGVRQAVTGHYRTKRIVPPTDVLLGLARAMPDHELRAFLGFLDQLDPSGITDTLLDSLLDVADAERRVFYTQRESVLRFSARQLERLILDTDARVRKSLATFHVGRLMLEPDGPQWLRLLMQDSDMTVRAASFSNADNPFWSELSQQPLEVRLLVAGTDFQKSVFSLRPASRERFAQVLDMLAADPDESVRLAVAKDRITTRETLLRLANDTSARFRLASQRTVNP